jgi:hypothetical protein
MEMEETLISNSQPLNFEHQIQSNLLINEPPSFLNKSGNNLHMTHGIESSKNGNIHLKNNNINQNSCATPINFQNYYNMEDDQPTR